MTQLAARNRSAGTSAIGVPERLVRVFDAPLRSWRRLAAEPLDAAYYVQLEGGAEQVLWISQRAPDEPRVTRCAAALKLLEGFSTPLVRADTSLTRLEYPYLITEYLDIQTLGDVWLQNAKVANANLKEQVVAAWGTAVRFLHRTRFDLAGDLALPETSGVRLADDFSALWRQPLRLAVKDYMLDTPKLVAALRRGRTLLRDAPITLTHGHPGFNAFLYDPERAHVVAALDFGDARRSDPMTDLAAIMESLETLGCYDAFVDGYGALSHWEKKRLAFYRLHYDLLAYAQALTVLPNELARRRMRLVQRLAELS